MRFRCLAAIALVCTAPMMGWEASAAVMDAPVTAHPRPAALAFAQAIGSDTIIINEQNDRTVGIPLMEISVRDELADVEKERPGITRAVATALMSVVNRSARERLPELNRRIGLFYEEHFTDAELEVVTRFVRSPVGQRYIATASENMRTDATTAAVQRGSGSGRLMRAIKKDGEAADSAARAALAAEDRAAIDAFEASDLGKRFDRLEDRAIKIVETWSSEETPWEKAAMEAAVADTIAAYPVGESK